jgi:predicted TIM-barrel fold metal-dependent hydrolase
MTRIDIPLIDCHTHIGRLPGVFSDGYTAEDLLYIAENEGAEFMLVSSASTTTVNQTFGTAEAIAMVEKHGDKLGGMLWVNPRDPAWKADVERAVQHGFYGLKIHPPLDHYAVERAALDEVFACAQAHHWPILTHVDNDGGGPMSGLRYEPLLKAYPDVIVILAHMRLEAMALARRYANAYIDTTYMDPLIVEIGVAAVGADRILFGSDAAEGFDVGHVPGHVRPRRSYAALIEGLRGRGISEGDLAKMTYHNARALFKIGERR